MAITRAQIARELYIKGGVVNPDGRRGFGGGADMGASSKGYQGGGSKSSKSSSSKSSKSSKSSNTGYTGGGGGGQDMGADSLPSYLPPGYDLDENKFVKPDGSDETAYVSPTKKEVNKIFEKKKKQNIFKKKFVTPTQKALYEIFPNNPKNEKAYIEYLQSLGVNVPSDLLTAMEEEDKKLSFDDFQKLVGYEPDFMLPGEEGLFQPMNFAEYMASQGNFGLITGGNLGNLKDFKNPGGIIDPKTGLPMTDFEFEKLKQSSSQYNTGGGGDPMDPCKGPNPPAYCNIDPPSDPNDPSTPSTGVFAGIAPRFAGSIFDFDALRAGAMDGGIMNNDIIGGAADGNIDEMGRQMYFVGKLVKKATRAVKKIAKSPFGKAALFAAPFLMNPAARAGIGSFFGKGSFNPLRMAAAATSDKQMTQLSPLGKILAKFGMATGEGGGKLTLGGKIGLGLGLPFALDLLGVGKDDDDKMDLDEYYRTQGINIPDTRNNPYNFLSAANQGSLFAADGGLMRMGYQEGGDAEPVAKKTMPLIDMDGKEKDYRETGGFVDMGRMERADDVPARLSKNEFVFTADAVRNAGDGDIDKGAEVMYNMMKNLEAGGEVSEESQGLEGAREMFQTSQRLGEVI